ncbi:MAG: GTP 3',8-cyclase MoaA [Lachnospiraceae bacterium]|nr:GTP 3',8-cyclase MoaA [Lachnospiraceae bacterium]
MRDPYGRSIDYMRLSITDLCNLRCNYCIPHGICRVPMREILTYEEILEIVETAVSLGITKYKVTGGEPLVRREALSFIRRLKEVEGLSQVTMTTNGILLKEKLEELKGTGLDGLNISLDTMNPDTYCRITGFPEFSRVLDGIYASVEAGIRTKVNVVLQKGINEGDWKDLILLSRDLPVDVRFIELMPIGEGDCSKGIDNRLLKEEIRRLYPDLEEDNSIHGNGPAVYVHIPGFQGSIGFISAMHGKFCTHCNRLRLTSVGELKPCLCYEDSVDLKAILRSEEKEGRRTLLKEAIMKAISQKPGSHCFEEPCSISEQKRMVDIGG